MSQNRKYLPDTPGKLQNRGVEAGVGGPGAHRVTQRMRGVL